jgi:hypothetical protein
VKLPHTERAPIAQPRSLFVSPGGDPEASGTSLATPTDFATANARVKPGWTVTVLPGNYTAPVRTTKNGTSKNRIVWKSAGQHAAIITVLPADVIVWLNTASYVDIIGFDISGGRLGIQSSGKHVLIASNRIHHVGYRCTSLGGAGITAVVPTTIRGNLIDSIGLFDPPCETYHGVIHAKGSILDNNTIQNCSGSSTWP